MSSYVDALKRWSEDDGPGGAADPYAALRSRLEALTRDRPLAGLVIAGVDRGDDAYRVALGYATSLVPARRRVLLVDADLRSTGRPRAVAAPPAGGDFASLVAAGRWPAPTNEAGVHVVAATAIANPEEVLGHPACTEWLRKQTERFGFVVVAAPPVLVWPDAVPPAKALGGIALATRNRPGFESDVARAQNGLAAAGCRVLGVVLHGAENA